MLFSRTFRSAGCPMCDDRVVRVVAALGAAVLAVAGYATPFSDGLNREIAAKSAAGGGVVTVPDGIWESGPIHFRNNVELHLSDGAEIVFSDDPEEYLPAVSTGHTGIELMGFSPMVYAYGCTNVALTGRGVLRPRMDVWRKWMRGVNEAGARAAEALYHWCSTNAPLEARDLTKFAGDTHARPHFIMFKRCRGVRIEDVRIRQSPSWIIHLYLSDDIVVRGIDVFAYGSNNDAIDVEMCANVLIEDCSILGGDDGICLKGGRNRDGWRLGKPTENVTVRRCRIYNAHTVLGIGSELSSGIRNVLVENCTADVVRCVFLVKTNDRRGGFVKNVRLRNVEVGYTDEVVGLNFNSFRWNFPDFELRRTEVSDLLVENVHVRKARRNTPVGATPARNVVVRNVTVDELGERRTGLLTDRIENADRYAALSPDFAKAFAFLRDPKLFTLGPGRYPIDGDRVWAEVSDVMLKPIEEGVMEKDDDHVQIHMTYGIDGKGSTVSWEGVSFGEPAATCGVAPFTCICANIFMIVYPGQSFAPCLSNCGPWKERRVVVSLSARTVPDR